MQNQTIESLLYHIEKKLSDKTLKKFGSSLDVQLESIAQDLDNVLSAILLAPISSQSTKSRLKHISLSLMSVTCSLARTIRCTQSSLRTYKRITLALNFLALLLLLFGLTKALLLVTAVSSLILFTILIYGD